MGEPIRLDRDFFAQDTLLVARELLGKHLVRLYEGERLSGRIVEVEAYIGEDDQASHAAVGPTARNRSMYGPPGCAYVYLIYGMHHCLNIVTEAEEFPAAILIRALEPEEGVETMRRLRPGRRDHELTSGPARLCYALAIDRSFDGHDLCSPGALLWVEDAPTVPEEQVATSPRIGVRGDERALQAPWRFFVRNNPWVSRR